MANAFQLQVPQGLGNALAPQTGGIFDPLTQMIAGQQAMDYTQAVQNVNQQLAQQQAEQNRQEVEQARFVENEYAKYLQDERLRQQAAQESAMAEKRFGYESSLQKERIAAEAQARREERALRRQEQADERSNLYLTPAIATDINTKSTAVADFVDSAVSLRNELANNQEDLTYTRDFGGSGLNRIREEISGAYNLVSGSIGKDGADKITAIIDESIASTGNEKAKQYQGRAKIKSVIMKWAATRGEGLAKMSNADLRMMVDSLVGTWGDKQSVINNLDRNIDSTVKSHRNFLDTQNKTFKNAGVLSSTFETMMSGVNQERVTPKSSTTDAKNVQQTKGKLTVGDYVNGNRYLGGDPTKQSSWKKER